MKKETILSNKWLPFYVILATVLMKIPILFTHHLQEDSFITWKVAKNVLEYGVIGFNGLDKISASTTHLYVLVSTIFQFLLGDNFIYPILIFNSLLFGIGSWYLSKMLFPTNTSLSVLFVILLNLTPPALTASALGMEYGILFFLYCSLIYFGLYKDKHWTFIIFPILLLWTRIDTVIFLGIFFLVDALYRKRINFTFIIGGIIGVVSVVGFNYLYFGGLVNHTITAKKLAYESLRDRITFDMFITQMTYYGGLIKLTSNWVVLLFGCFLLFLGFVLANIYKKRDTISQFTIFTLLGIFVFAMAKISIFVYFKAFFDWYYWLPRVFLFAVVIFYFLYFKPFRKITLPFLFILFAGLYAFQFLQSYAIGNMEKNQRMEIVKDLLFYSKGKGLEESVMLEPAGKVPFYTGLRTYDEVGLVNKEVMNQMIEHPKNWWISSVKELKPNYLVTIEYKIGQGSFYKMSEEDLKYIDEHYELKKEYPISKIHHSESQILNSIYKIRPIGKNYFLYIRKETK